MCNPGIIIIFLSTGFKKLYVLNRPPRRAAYRVSLTEPLYSINFLFIQIF